MTQKLKPTPWVPGNLLIRLRNGETVDIAPYNLYLRQAIHLTDLLYTLPELENSWPGIFEDTSLPILMEIGCYMGETVAEVGKRNPEFNILGVDIKYKRVVKSCNRIKREGLTNAKIAMGDARKLLAIIPDCSLFGILAFFPDPWQKRRHEKNRFLDDSFFETAYRKLTGNGFIWIKTDNGSYYEEVMERVRKFDYAIADTLPLPRPLIGEKYHTFFEQLFRRKNKPVHQLFIQKV